MYIKKIIIKGLYGFIDKNIEFNEDITLLVGINGSGKTSILNLLNWIIKPSLPNLCITQFKNITLYFTYRNIEYNIKCKHSKSTFKYYLNSSNQSEIFNPLVVKLKEQPSNLSHDEDLRNRVIESYYDLSPTEKEENTWEFIKKLPDPIIIGLDRSIYSEDSQRYYVEEVQQGEIVRKVKRPTLTPLNKVKDIVNTEYRKSNDAILKLTKGLKNHLMLSAFEGSISLDSIDSGIKAKLTIDQVDNAEKRVKDYFTKYEKSTFSVK